jgi:Flp pilus assembly protein TadG
MTRKWLQHCRFKRVLRGSEAGQALVETALTMPLLILMLLGAVELGRVAFAAIEVSNAARAGAQYAAMNGGSYKDNTSTGGIAQAAQYDAYNVWAPQPTKFTVTSSYGCVCSNGSSSTCLSTDCSGGSNHLMATVTVVTQATFDPLIHFWGLPNTFTLQGKAVQQVLQ